ncbi:MAG: hypothetical protein LKF52_07660 [Butyrivibrio sp.]|jgi:flagellar basal body-associated protein FliL|nr:hypothetical protein [Butyrivibrio sp.]
MNHTAKAKSGKMAPTLYMTLIALIIACLAGVYAWFLISDYEKGVSEIYAQEQDGYVQLVLDQINLQPENTDEQIIQNILGTLDSSTNRYWTLSHDKTLVFVKDVLETSRYKSFSADTYYNTVSSREFVSSLQQDKVTHAMIEIDGRKFIASGVKFIYDSKDYQICLLTNADIMLENNTYLSTKINLIIMIIVILVIFVISMIVLARLVNGQNRAILAEKRTEEELRRNLEQMNEQLHNQRMYDSETMIFGSAMIPTMLQKLEQRGSRPLVLVMVPSDERSYQILTDKGQLLLGKNVIRMKLDADYILLIFVQCHRRDAERMLLTLAPYGIKAEQIFEVSETESRSVEECFRELTAENGRSKEK